MRCHTRLDPELHQRAQLNSKKPYGGLAWQRANIECSNILATLFCTPSTSHVDSAHLMDGSAVPLVHLVKLVDAADALVCQHQRATLQHLPAGRAAVRQPHQTWPLQWLPACAVLQQSSLHEGCSARAGPTQPVQGSSACSLLQPECTEPGLLLWAHAGPCSAVAGAPLPSLSSLPAPVAGSFLHHEAAWF